MDRIPITDAMRAMARRIANQRQAQTRSYRSAQDQNKRENSWEHEIVGAMGEVAVAIRLGCLESIDRGWHGRRSQGAPDLWTQHNLRLGIKATKHRNGKLLVKLTDWSPFCPVLVDYVVLVRCFEGVATIVGCIDSWAFDNLRERAPKKLAPYRGCWTCPGPFQPLEKVETLGRDDPHGMSLYAMEGCDG
jgi:hypothetical protein